MKALKQQLSRESVAGVLFTLPFTIGFLLFMIVPMGISLYYSFCDYNILSPPVFTGMKNFISMFRDETFFKTLKVTFFFAFVSVPLKLLFALIVAMLLQKCPDSTGRPITFPPLSAALWLFPFFGRGCLPWMGL